MADSRSQSQEPCEEQPSTSRQEQRPKRVVYKTKNIRFFDHSTPTIFQDENGPCPLIAICNVLLLNGTLKLSQSENETEVSQEELLSFLHEYLNDHSQEVENQQIKIADAKKFLPRLATGLDVNLKFRKIDDFVVTPQSAIFELLKIPLYHGWIVDPTDVPTANAIGEKSYDDLQVELVACDDHSSLLHTDKSETITSTTDDGGPAYKGELISKFLREFASQLTPYGLDCLRSGLAEHELCVLFQNNHFSTMFKHENELYRLATDDGFSDKPVVWEKLIEVNNNNTYVTETFKMSSISVQVQDNDVFNFDGMAQLVFDENFDHQLAVELQREEYSNCHNLRQTSFSKEEL